MAVELHPMTEVGSAASWSSFRTSATPGINLRLGAGPGNSPLDVSLWHPGGPYFMLAWRFRLDVGAC